MFEHRTDPLLPRREFFGRLMRSAAAGAGIIAASLFIGMLAHHALEGFSWLNAFVNPQSSSRPMPTGEKQ